MNDKLKMLIIENNKETLSNMQIKKIRPWECVFNCIGCAKRLSFYDVMHDEYKEGECYCGECEQKN